MKKNTYFIPTGEWSLIENYQELMEEAGFVETDESSAWVLLLPGGSDIGMLPERDDLEFLVYNTWLKNQKPVLGICRGMQMMITLDGGDMISHIPDIISEKMHTTLTGDWLGQSSWHTTNIGLLTNSRHHQGFITVPESWSVIDNTSDGIIEAVQKDNQFAVQWHPEHPEMKNTPARRWWIKMAKSIV